MPLCALLHLSHLNKFCEWQGNKQSIQRGLNRTSTYLSWCWTWPLNLILDVALLRFPPKRCSTGRRRDWDFKGTSFLSGIVFSNQVFPNQPMLENFVTELSKFICLESKKSLFCKATSPQYLSSLQHSRQPNILVVRGAIKIIAILGSKNLDQPQVAGYLRITTNPWKALEPETQGSPSGVPADFGGVDEDASSKNSTNVHRFFEIPHAV